MKSIKLYPFIIILCFFLVSCSEENDKIDEPKDGMDTLHMDDHPVINETFFQVPSPGEMLSFIKLVGGKNNKNTSFLNPPDNAKNYNDPFTKATNFGIYSTDLSYCSIFEIGAEALKYFKIVKQTGDEIGVSSAVNPQILSRIETNLSSPDSLSVIADEIYFSSFELLENSKQGPQLALMVAGGWIESLFIATQLAKYEQGSMVIERLADQKYTLENLIEFIKKYNSDPNVLKVQNDFQSLLDIYNQLAESDIQKKTNTGSNKQQNVKVLEGGKVLSMSSDQFKKIKEKVASIRNSYTQVK